MTKLQALQYLCDNRIIVLSDYFNVSVTNKGSKYEPKK